MTEDNMEAETRRLNAEIRLLSVKRGLAMLMSVADVGACLDLCGSDAVTETENLGLEHLHAWQGQGDMRADLWDVIACTCAPWTGNSCRSMSPIMARSSASRIAFIQTRTSNDRDQGATA